MGKNVLPSLLALVEIWALAFHPDYNSDITYTGSVGRATAQPTTAPTPIPADTLTLMPTSTPTLQAITPLARTHSRRTQSSEAPGASD